MEVPFEKADADVRKQKNPGAGSSRLTGIKEVRQTEVVGIIHTNMNV
jgi:hypothetical protein